MNRALERKTRHTAPCAVFGGAGVGRPLVHLTAALGCWFSLLVAVDATTIQHKDGRMLEGRIGKTTGIADNLNGSQPTAGEVDVAPILLLDNGLSRTYLNRRQAINIVEGHTAPHVKIRVWQNVAQSQRAVGRVGAPLNVTKFDKFGRRIFEMPVRDGVLAVIQGITEITPVYVRVRGLVGAENAVSWDMRLATSSVPREILAEIIRTAVDQEDSRARLEVVTFYLQAERYPEAHQELERIIVDFPELEGLEKQARQLRQLGARTILREIKMRRQAGQHQLVKLWLERFPSDGVAGETLQEVRELLAIYGQQQQRGERALQSMRSAVDELAEPPLRERVRAMVGQIASALSHSTLDRMAPLLQVGQQPEFGPQQRLALALSAWVLGPEGATENLPVALSLWEVRDLVVEYLRETNVKRRAELIALLQEKEGGSVERVAKMLAKLRPPVPITDETTVSPSCYEMHCPGFEGGADIRYLLQLPAEYDPYRRYPLLFVLNGAGNTPEQALNFWAGAPAADGQRRGQAVRHGYLTLSVDWQKPHQAQYEYSAREHYAVLGCLRHALRRFSIDTDRVFITGHSRGGTAAWDLALAHPDIWAGAIPFVARGDKYCKFYGKNAQHVPLYFIAGELDGDTIRHNAPMWDRYLTPKYDTAVVEFQGRGHEPFSDEILNVFDWMGRRRRDFSPSQFECVAMRPWDNFFWWLEIDGLPPKALVLPHAWKARRDQRAANFKARVFERRRIRVQSASQHNIIWLSPELVDFDEKIVVEINGRRISGRNRVVEPQLSVLLEDARRRGDLAHPFWAKVEQGERPPALR